MPDVHHHQGGYCVDCVVPMYEWPREIAELLIVSRMEKSFVGCMRPNEQGGFYLREPK